MTETAITENEVLYTQVDALITQIEALLQTIAKKTIVDSSSMQDGLLDIMQSVRQIKDTSR